MKKIFLLFTVTTLLFACSKEKQKDPEFKGADVKVYSGKTWSTFKTDKEGVPQQLSLVLDDAALNSVPVGGNDEGHMHDNTFLVPIHHKAGESTPYQFIMLNWNPNGHEPTNIYTLPHFDIHFYMTPATDVLTYTDPVKLENQPAPAYIPANHISGPGVPMMGKHWIDVASPELTGQVPFTQTFIYGSYNGKVVFYEPMITLNFLQTNSNYERAIPQPQKFQTSGYYPTRMKVLKHDGVTEIVLTGFVKRQAS